jgi:hypothetical protein
MKRPLPNLLVQGFRLALRNWPLVVWAYAVNLVFGLLVGVPFATGLAPYLDHSLAAQKIAGTLDLMYLGELMRHLRDGSLLPIAFHTAGWLSLLQVLVLFLLFAGTVFAYVSGEPPQLSVLMRGGVAYFWRFVRTALIAGCIAILILGALLAARAALLAHASAVYVERRMFLYSALSAGVVLFAALLLRLWWDLVEVYLVRNAMDGERQVRHALLPALKLLFRYFFRTVGSFLLAGVAGVSALALCLFIWKELIPAHQVWIACLLAQIGLFLLLSSRFWQRGIEAALVMSADPPMVATVEIEAMDDEDTPALVEVEPLAVTTEPTLRDLVLKLRTDPWAPPEVVLPPSPNPPPEPGKANEAPTSLLDRHTTKFPLGGVNPEEPSVNSGEKAKVLGDREKPPGPGKKP